MSVLPTVQSATAAAWRISAPSSREMLLPIKQQPKASLQANLHAKNLLQNPVNPKQNNLNESKEKDRMFWLHPVFFLFCKGNQGFLPFPALLFPSFTMDNLYAIAADNAWDKVLTPINWMSTSAPVSYTHLQEFRSGTGGRCWPQEGGIHRLFWQKRHPHAHHGDLKIGHHQKGDAIVIFHFS